MSAMPGSIDTKLWREEPNLFATLAWILEFLDCIWTLYDTLFICINCGVKTIKVSLYVSLYFTLFDTSSQNMELALDLGALRLRCCPMHRSMELRSELREVTATVAGHGLYHGHPKKRLKNCHKLSAQVWLLCWMQQSWGVPLSNIQDLLWGCQARTLEQQSW